MVDQSAARDQPPARAAPWPRMAEQAILAVIDPHQFAYYRRTILTNRCGRIGPVQQLPEIGNRVPIFYGNQGVGARSAAAAHGCAQTIQNRLSIGLRGFSRQNGHGAGANFGRQVEHGSMGKGRRRINALDPIECFHKRHSPRHPRVGASAESRVPDSPGPARPTPITRGQNFLIRKRRFGGGLIRPSPAGRLTKPSRRTQARAVPSISLLPALTDILRPYARSNPTPANLPLRQYGGG